MSNLNAWDDLTEALLDGETVEAIVFGPWGWGSPPQNPDSPWEPGYSEPEPPPIPFDKMGKILSPQEAKPMMEGWSFFGGYGAPKCPAVYIWTNQRVLWVTQYDGSTRLNDAPRNPIECMPVMPGG